MSDLFPLFRLSLAVMVVAAACCTLGCSDKSRRLSEFEALQYKRQLIDANRAQISEEQANLLGQHSARTQADIDAAFQEFRLQYAEAQAADRARFEEERRSQQGSEGSRGTSLR